MESKCQENPFPNLLTDKLVETAVQNEFSEDARLESFKVEDFTKPGDNFASRVTGVEAEYILNGEKKSTFYVAKMNTGQLPKEGHLVDYITHAYIREPVVLGPIRDSINKNFKDMSLPPLKSPKCFASCVEKDKEVIITEDLRPQGFVMFDKRKGMDLAHAKFVMEELGRYHAGSIVNESIEGTTFERRFPQIVDPYFADVDHEYLKGWSQMFKGQVDMSLEIIKALNSKHTNSIFQWWNNVKNYGSNIMNRNADPSEKFNVFIHGDCWNNNILFKYDENGEPVDFRFVDFQMNRKGTPVTDLNHFFYTSLGDIRKKHMRTLLVHYYLAFSKVLMLAQKPIPFTFEELQAECKIKTGHGFLVSAMLSPTTLVKPEDAISLTDMIDNPSPEVKEKRDRFFKYVVGDKNLKERFLSMFEDAADCGIFSKPRTIFNPHEILKEEHVEQALHNDIGKEATLKAFEVQNFTNKGDNHSSTVVAIKVYYEHNGSLKEISYVVKLNPQDNPQQMQHISEALYKKEITMLTKITSALNNELNEIDLPRLKVPKALSYCYDVSKEVLILENLRRKGFKMFDRKKGMDLAHILLVVKELGRLHGSSLLYQRTCKRPLVEEHKIDFEELWIDPDNSGFKLVNTIMSSKLDNCISLLSGKEKYERAIPWLQKMKPKVTETFYPKYDPKCKFNALSHGDCWTNNFLFKYEEDGTPADLRLLDLQISRVRSVVHDIACLLYSSSNADTRMENLNIILTEYYISFCMVLMLGNVDVPFTFIELQEEMKQKVIYSCVVGLFSAGIYFNDIKPDGFDNMSLDNMDNHHDHYMLKLFKQAAENTEVFRKRFLFFFDELFDNNLIE